MAVPPHAATIGRGEREQAVGGGATMSRVSDLILSLHGWVALLIVFLLPALEASVFVGVVVPGEIAVILGGVLGFERRVSLPAVLVAAIAGAVAGDTVGYLVGRRWGRRLLDRSIGRVVKREHIDRAQGYLARRGGRSVLLGRWTAALRALIPGLAGMSGVHYRTFALYNLIGGALWATTFVLLGYVSGAGWRQVEAVAKQASLLLVVVVVLVAATVLAARHVARHPERFRAAARRVADRPLVARLRARYHRQLTFLARRLRPGGALGLSLTLGLVAVGLTGWAFGAVLQDVLAHENLTEVDQPLWRFLQRHREPWATGTLRLVVRLESPWLLGGVAVAGGVALWLLHRRRPGPNRPSLNGSGWQALWLLLAAWLGGEALASMVAALVGRPRPPLALLAAAGSAFPSREATAGAALYGMLAALLGAATSRWTARVALWTAALLLLGAVGLGQTYLGSNWLSDVLGGGALGGLWLVVLLTAVTTARRLHADGTGGGQRPRAPASQLPGPGSRR
jgi:membrane protein DedA with SNARE-associated domain/membrane-associated phospholipid phosphatase